MSVYFDDGATLGADVAAGDPAVVGWNNAKGAGAGQGDDGVRALTDEAGAATGITVAWSCQDIEVTPETGDGTVGDRTMMALGCRSWMGMGDAAFALTGLAAAFPNGYDVIAYVGHGGGPAHRRHQRPPARQPLSRGRK